MSIFGSIVSAIFGKSGTTAAVPSTGTAPAPSAPAGNAASSGPTTVPTVLAAAPSVPKPMTQEEVEGVIAKLAGQSKEKLNWKQSIVDLMKLLNLDSSLNARKQLA